MVFLETIYDYDIKKECFKVCMEKGYVKSTDILFNPVSLDTNEMDYATQTFTVNIVGDRGESTIAFYDNDSPISFYIGGTEYQRIDWTQEMSETTITMRLNYGVNHEIQARYSGNRKCMPCSSKILPLYIDYPPSHATSISLSTTKTNNSFLNNEPVIVNGVLTDLEEGAIANKELTVYVDNVPSTVETNNEGAFVFNSNSLSHGRHTIKAEFEGEEHYYFDSSKSINISKGYVVKAQTENIWLQMIGEISVSVEDYFGNPIPNCSVSCNISTDNQTTLSATTNSNGKATLQNNDMTLTLKPNLTVKTTYNDVSSSLPVTGAYLYHYGWKVNGENPIVPLGKSFSATVYANASDKSGNPISLEGLKIPINSTKNPYLDETLYLNENSEATVRYTGTGVGNNTLKMYIENTSTHSDLNIQEVLQYWKAGSNQSVVNYKELLGRVLSLTNGWRITSDNNSFACISLPVDSNFNDDFDLSFTVVSSTMHGFGVGIGGDSVIFDSEHISDVSFKFYDKILISRRGNVISLSKNGSVFDSFEISGSGSPVIVAHGKKVTPSVYIGGTATNGIPYTESGVLTIDNLVFKRV